MKQDKQMWDSETRSWVPFDIRGAHFIVNIRKEYLALRVFHPPVLTEYGHSLEGWQTIDSSYMQDQLKEDKNDCEKDTPYQSYSGYQAWREMIQQDRQEYINENRIAESMRI
jgi:hypothetical protein